MADGILPGTPVNGGKPQVGQAPLPQVRPAAKPQEQGQQPVRGGAFANILAGELAKGRAVKFSAHAEKRLVSRQIKLSEQQMAQLGNAVDKAAAKGALESLILMPDLALVVSIRNRTVITAIDGASIKDNVFTNIDSAVIT